MDRLKVKIIKLSVVYTQKVIKSQSNYKPIDTLVEG